MPQVEVDDVAFLNGGSAKKQTLLVRNSSSMENVRPLVCSKGQTLCVTAIVLTVLVAISLIAAFARPFQHCNHLNGDDDDDDKASPTAFPYASTPPLPPTAITGEVFPWESIRLPDFIDPLHYSLFMHPNLTTFTNKGSVNITFRLLKDSDFIVLHSKDLEIESVEVFAPDDDDKDKDPEEVEILRHLLYPPHEQLYVEFKESLDAGVNYTIEIEFSKILEEKLEGFYISSYSTHDGEKRFGEVPSLYLDEFGAERFLATTHFEATAARTAFPCFDEPSFKATFELDIVHSRYHNAYFNTPLIEEDEYGKTDLFISSFETSVRMSTYLVAFVVCDFKSVEQMTENGVKVRVLAPEEMLDQTKFALTTAVEVLDHFHNFFNIEYPLKKLDLIAVPDFGPGAMENWGLITFRTTAVLFNENESSITNEENIATIVAHELAHQWFGNLVTMEWWNDLWLNEGFASFVENLGTNHIRPEWKMMDQFTLVTTQDALALDSLESTHPILADVNNPTEIEAIFDAISYKKGSAIIQMLEEFLGLETLREGLTFYLNKYRFDNAETKDLWDAFTQVTPKSAHLDVAEIMNTWTQQKGFPLLRVKHSWRKMSITQERFLLTPNDDSDSDTDNDGEEDDEADEDDISPFGYKWYVPVTYITDEEPNDPELVWLNMTDGEFPLGEAVDWIKVNVNQTGFYRVMYDKENWRKLIELLHENHKTLSPADRASLIDDAMVLSHVGLLNSSVAFDLVDYLEKERDYVPWETALIHFDTLDSLLQESAAYPDYQEYVLELLKPLIELVGWEDEGSHLERKLRASVLATAVKYGHEDSIKKATELFEAWKEGGAHLSPNLRSVIYMAGVKHGDEEDWEFCWDKYLHSTVPSDKHLLLTALGNTDDIWQLSQYLDYSLDKDKVRPQDVTSVITVAARNPIGRLLTWRFVRSHWSQLLNMFGELSFSLDVIISESVSHFSTEFDYKEVESFFSSVQTGTGASSVKQSLERIRANIYWNDEIEDDLIAWLKKHVN